MVRRKYAPPPHESSAQSWFWASLVLSLFVVFFLINPKHTEEPEVKRVLEPSWSQMTAAISEVVNAYDGDVGVYLKNLKTGDVFERNANQKFITASLIKVPIMAATFQAIQDGRLSLNSSIVLRRRHIRDGSGELKWSNIGRRFRVSTLLYEMITKSDNTAAQVFIDLLGYDGLNNAFEHFGLNVTRISPTGMSLANHVNEEFDNYTTPHEMGDLLEKIYQHKLVSDGYSDLMMGIMKKAHAPSRLGKYLPKNFALARKSGLLRKNCHDVGIVFTPKGDYLICILTGNNATYKKAKGLIANIGHTAYDYLGRS